MNNLDIIIGNFREHIENDEKTKQQIINQMNDIHLKIELYFKTSKNIDINTTKNKILYTYTNEIGEVIYVIDGFAPKKDNEKEAEYLIRMARAYSLIDSAKSYTRSLQRLNDGISRYLGIIKKIEDEKGLL